MNINRRTRRAQQVRANYLKAKRDWLMEQEKADEKKAALEKAEKVIKAADEVLSVSVIENPENIKEAAGRISASFRRAESEPAPDEPKAPYQCRLCGRNFKTGSGFNSHMRTKHEGEI